MRYGTGFGNPCILATEAVALRAVRLASEILGFKMLRVALCICEHNRSKKEQVQGLLAERRQQQQLSPQHTSKECFMGDLNLTF